MEMIKKTKINWLIKDDSVIVFDKYQATCYIDMSARNRTKFDEFKNELLNNNEEYNGWVDIMCLAQEKGIIGYGTRVKKEWF